MGETALWIAGESRGLLPKLAPNSAERDPGRTPARSRRLKFSSVSDQRHMDQNVVLSDAMETSSRLSGMDC